VTQRIDETIRESAPLCLATDSGWGGVLRGWAWIGANCTMRRQVSVVKTDGCRPRRPCSDSSQRRGAADGPRKGFNPPAI